MFTVVFALHLLLCVILIGLVLVQQGKGADMGAAFGGGSNTFFGAAGATAFITKLTTGVAVAFMVTSILLINLNSSRVAAGGAPAASGQIQDLLNTGAPAAKEAPQAPAANPAAAPAEAPQQAAPAQPAPAQNAPAAPAPQQ